MVILFDFDEVLVDINPGAIKHINQKLGTNYKLEDITSWDFFGEGECGKAFFEYLALPNLYQEHAIPNKHMLGVMKQMMELGHQVCIVTATAECSQDSKYRYIVEQLGFFDTKNLYTVNQSSKYKYKSDVLDELAPDYNEPIVLIDDGVHNVLDFMADTNHKEGLDGMMRTFYNSRVLKKFNNPYHDFVYGIMPQLPYNQRLEEGGRIYKVNQPKEIWGVLEKIKIQHARRVQNKQAEAFNYLSNVVNDLLPQEHFKEVNELQNNVSYAVKAVLGRVSTNSDFLSNVARFVVKVEKILQENSDVKGVEQVFAGADQKFGSDVLYTEIKNLTLLHLGIKTPEVAAFAKKSKSAGVFHGDDVQLSTGVIKQIIDSTKNTMTAVNRALAEEKSEWLSEVFTKANMKNVGLDEVSRADVRANVMLAFMKNWILDQNKPKLTAKNSELEASRIELVNQSQVKARRTLKR